MLRTRFLPLFITLLLAGGCLHFPNWPPATDEELQATVIYRTLKGEQRIANISLTSVRSDQALAKDKDIKLQQTDQNLVPLSYKADGIYAESLNGQSVHLVTGRNLTDPVLTTTPNPDLHVLSYITMQGRKPVLKLRTIYKGDVSDRGTVLPLAAEVDNYVISDFTNKETP